jgi:magnesium transporter
VADTLPPDEPELPSDEDLRAAWPLLTSADRYDGFRMLAPRVVAEDFFVSLSAADQVDLVHSMPAAERRAWVRSLDPDDAADFLQEARDDERDGYLAMMDLAMRKEVGALLAFEEDDAGGLMNPRFARVRPDMPVEEALRYLRMQARERLETIYYAYCLDGEQRLFGVVSLRELFAASAEKSVRDIMRTDLVTAREDMDQEALSRLIAEHDLVAIPVLDAEGRMKGIVTVDDIVDVVQEEATEDMQRMGGSGVLDAPYMETSFGEMLRKRIGWLAVLFMGGMLTTSAMNLFGADLEHAVWLAIFLPFIVSSGGNSGSQATTLVIRAMALGEVHLRDWWLVARRELAMGLVLGACLGALGFVRIAAWHLAGADPDAAGPYGERYALVGITVAISVAGVVTWGTLVGAMLPFALKRAGLDPASASAPLVATVVDVCGVLIYFATAGLLLRGTLLPV